MKTLNMIHNITEPSSDSISMIWLLMYCQLHVCVSGMRNRKKNTDRVRGRATHYTYMDIHVHSTLAHIGKKER